MSCRRSKAIVAPRSRNAHEDNYGFIETGASNAQNKAQPIKMCWNRTEKLGLKPPSDRDSAQSAIRRPCPPPHHGRCAEQYRSYRMRSLHLFAEPVK